MIAFFVSFFILTYLTVYFIRSVFLIGSYCTTPAGGERGSLALEDYPSGNDVRPKAVKAEINFKGFLYKNLPPWLQGPP